MKKALFLLFACLTTESRAEHSAFKICQFKTCDVIVDVGYTGVRVHVYAYDAKNFRQDKIIQQIYAKKIHRSLSKIPLSEVAHALDYLFKDFPKLMFNTYLYATEGYRSMSLRQEIQYSRVTRAWFRKQKYLHLVEMRKISGHEEASYAWISNDYLLGHLPQQTGIIEIGGGSAQVAVNVEHNIDQSNVMQFISFNQALLKVWTSSLHQYGREKMSSRVSCMAPMDIQFCVEKLKKTAQSLESNSVSGIQHLMKTLSPDVHWYGLGLFNYIGFSPYIRAQHPFSYAISDLLQQNACRWPLLDIPYADKACFNMAYAYTLTHELFGMHAATNINIYPLQGGQGWPQGILIWRLLKN